MGDVRTQLPMLREYKEKGRVRYVGVTTTFESQYDALVQAMRELQNGSFIKASA